MSLDENKAIIRSFYEEVGMKRNHALADEIIAPGFKMFPDSPPPDGAEGIKLFMEWLFSVLPDLDITIEDMVAEGDTVAVRVTLHATPAKPLNWVEGLEAVTPNGKRIHMREYVFWRVVDGKIVGRSIVIDNLEALRQLDIPVAVKS